MGFKSVGIYEAVGYTNGEWHDVKWLQRSLGDHAVGPEPPLCISDACEHERWHDAVTNGESSIRL